MNKSHKQSSIQAVIGVAITVAVATMAGCATDSGSDDGDDSSASEEIATQASAMSVSACQGCERVDPLSLNPPAVQEDGPWFQGTAYECWKLPHATSGPTQTSGADISAPGGTVVECVHGPSVHTKGDGSLASNPDGIPDWFYGFDCPNGVSVADVGTVVWPATIRYYNAEKMTELVVFESIRGKLYNFVTGKSVKLIVDNIRIERINADGVGVAFVGNDFSASNDGHWLARSAGVVQYNYGNLSPTLLIEQGPHPLDDYYGKGDDSGLAKICAAVE